MEVKGGGLQKIQADGPPDRPSPTWQRTRHMASP